MSANPTAYMAFRPGRAVWLIDEWAGLSRGPVSRHRRPDLTARLGSGAVSGRLGGISGNLRVAGSPRIDDLGFPKGRGRVPRGLAGGSAVVVTKREVISFRPAVREALDQEPEKACPTAFSGGVRVRLRIAEINERNRREIAKIKERERLRREVERILRKLTQSPPTAKHWAEAELERIRREAGE